MTSFHKPIYCANCDTEAIWLIDTPSPDPEEDDGNLLPLCETCKTAFVWGQGNQAGIPLLIEDVAAEYDKVVAEEEWDDPF
jgi:hypothetical protein